MKEHNNPDTLHEVSRENPTVALGPRKESKEEIAEAPTSDIAEIVNSKTTQIFAHELLLEVPLTEVPLLATPSYKAGIGIGVEKTALYFKKCLVVPMARPNLINDVYQRYWTSRTKRLDAPKLRPETKKSIKVQRVIPSIEKMGTL